MEECKVFPLTDPLKLERLINSWLKENRHITITGRVGILDVMVLFYKGHGEGNLKYTNEELIAAVEAAGGNRTEAARTLGLDRHTITRRLDGKKCTDTEIEEALIKSGDNKSQAAEMLGISREHLYRRVKKMRNSSKL